MAIKPSLRAVHKRRPGRWRRLQRALLDLSGGDKHTALRLLNLKLTGFDGPKKVAVVKEVRAILGLGLKESKELVRRSRARLAAKRTAQSPLPLMALANTARGCRSATTCESASGGSGRSLNNRGLCHIEHPAMLAYAAAFVNPHLRRTPP